MAGHDARSAVPVASASEAPKARIVCARVPSAGPEVVSDAGSGSDSGTGIDFGREGPRAVLERAMRGEVEEPVAARRGRLARFALDRLSRIFRARGVEVVVREPAVETPEQELVDDLLSVVAVRADGSRGRRGNERRRAGGLRRPAEAGRERLAPDQDLPERR